MSKLNRRRVLRGMMNGGAVSVALPLLDCFLNGNGTALASGAPIPIRFGTWFWGCGVQARVFEPHKTGRGYDLPEEVASVAPVQNDINLITNLTAYRDSAPNICHYTGWVIFRAGRPPAVRGDMPGETVDVTIANQIGRTTRFANLTATANGDVRNTLSYENGHSPTIPEVMPISLYSRLFGPGFQDPNAATFTPDRRTMVRKSVLSGVMDHTKALLNEVGAQDKIRIDEYFSSVRRVEHQLEQQLVKPEPREACRPLQAPPEDIPLNTEATVVAQRHRLLTDLIAMGVACDQTRVFNMVYADPLSNTIKAGYEKPHHTTTHEERVDETLGYKPVCSWFTRRAMDEWAYYVQAFKNIKEGDGTLLDNVFIMCHTEHGDANIHALDGIAAFTAGRAGGKVKTGLHINAGGRQGSGLALTAMRVMGLDKVSWGEGSNAVSQDYSEILV